MPAVLRNSLAAEGVALSGVLLQAAELLVAGTLSPKSRLRYGLELGRVSQWCAQHGLRLLDLSPLDVGALVVARRDAGQDPRPMLSVLAFVYRTKSDPDEFLCELAHRRQRGVAGTESSLRLPSIPAMGFRCLSRALAAEIDRAGAAAAPHADEVTVELAGSADGRLVPIPRRIGDTTSYVDIKMTLTWVDPLEPIRKLLPEGWTLVRQPPRR